MNTNSPSNTNSQSIELSLDRSNNNLRSLQSAQFHDIQLFARGIYRGDFLSTRKVTQTLDNLEQAKSEYLEITHNIGITIDILLENRTRNQAVPFSEMRDFNKIISDLPHVLTPLISWTEQYANHPRQFILHKHSRKEAQTVARHLNRFRQKAIVFEKALLSKKTMDQGSFFISYAFPLEVSLEALRFSIASLIAFLQQIVISKSFNQ